MSRVSGNAMLTNHGKRVTVSEETEQKIRALIVTYGLGKATIMLRTTRITLDIVRTVGAPRATVDRIAARVDLETLRAARS